MKLQCCNKLRRPKVSFKANKGDLIGIVFLGGFFGGILFLIGWLTIALMISAISSGDFGERTWTGSRSGMGYILVIFLIYKATPYFFKILSFFVDYKLRVSSTCSVCGDKAEHVNLPSKADPF